MVTRSSPNAASGVVVFRDSEILSASETHATRTLLSCRLGGEGTRFAQLLSGIRPCDGKSCGAYENRGERAAGGTFQRPEASCGEGEDPRRGRNQLLNAGAAMVLTKEAAVEQL